MTRKFTSLFAALTLLSALSLSACGGLEDCPDEEKDALGACPDDTGEGEGGGDGGGEGGGGGGVTFSGLYDDHLTKCGNCHGPEGVAGGFRPGITEATLDFSTRDSAYRSITTGSASGLTGIQDPCNGVPFIGSTSGGSLLVASVDEAVRAAYDNPSAPDCNGDTISAMEMNPGLIPEDVVQGLKSWIDDGTPDL